jgi:ATP synthase protein I
VLLGNKRLAAFRLVGVGFYIALCIVGGVFGGIALDSRFGTSPVLTLVGLILGLVLAFYGVYQMLSPLWRDADHGED